MDNIEIKKIKTDYTKKNNDKIKKYKDLILESFIEFYGEEYRNIIINRFNDISFLYYINDVTIFYIVDSLKEEYNDKFKNTMFAAPYIIYLIKNNFYKQKVTNDNFYKLGINKIVGSSDEKLLTDINLLKYSIALALRDENQNPIEFNFNENKNFKRIIALPMFSFDDKDLFHEINHAITSEPVNKNGKFIVKCGLDYYGEDKKEYNEILNDIISLEIYDIFKKKCRDTIFEDDVMDEVLFETYTNHNRLIDEFYNKNKIKIKLSFIDENSFQLEKQDLEYLEELIKRHKNK